jgi:ATP-dependent DNA helicase 2 subunit 2
MPRRFVATAMAPTILSVVIMLVLVLISQNQIEASQRQQQHEGHTLTRKSIVFDLKTPKVFYCPQEKFSGDQLDKMIVKAQPLDKLCEFEGKQKPKGANSDCYNDVDETEFACDEKKRFMVSL